MFIRLAIAGYMPKRPVPCNKVIDVVAVPTNAAYLWTRRLLEIAGVHEVHYWNGQIEQLNESLKEAPA